MIKLKRESTSREGRTLIPEIQFDIFQQYKAVCDGHEVLASDILAAKWLQNTENRPF